jgi:hypothetical protein
MTREEAIKEIGWYRQLIEKRITLWGKGLSVEWSDRLVGNISDVAQRESLLELKEYDNGYYIGELNAKGQREGYGIYTLTNGKGWIMQAGFWQKDAPMGSHTIYDAAAPAAKRMLASVHFSGRRKKERGKIELSISPRGIDSRERKFRQWEGFSLSTMVVGLSIIYLLLMVIVRNARVAIFIIALIGLLYAFGCMRGRR